jgi:hypothetical protein
MIVCRAVRRQSQQRVLDISRLGSTAEVRILIRNRRNAHSTSRSYRDLGEPSRSNVSGVASTTANRHSRDGLELLPGSRHTEQRVRGILSLNLSLAGHDDRE